MMIPFDKEAVIETTKELVLCKSQKASSLHTGYILRIASAR